MLRTRFQDDLKTAIRNKDEVATRTIRLILAALKDRDIAARGKGNSEGIGDEEILATLQTMVKQRRESIEAYEKAGRQELADQEKAEIKVLQRFLPQQLGEGEIAEVVNAVIAEVNAAGIKDMGRVMGALKERYPGQMDFGKASGIVKEKLTGTG